MLCAGFQARSRWTTPIAPAGSCSCSRPSKATRRRHPSRSQTRARSPRGFTGPHVRAAGLEKDIAFCAQVDVLDVVPRFERMHGRAAEITKREEA